MASANVVEAAAEKETADWRFFLSARVGHREGVRADAAWVARVKQ
jgi:hypothetical protein